MDKSATTRWGILLSALISTVVAAFYPAADHATVDVSDPLPRTRKLNERPLVNGVVAPVDVDAPAEDVDPFAQRNWQTPPPPTPVVQPAPITVATVDLTPAGPPELPFRFVGSMSDSAEQLVYLSRGDVAIVARTGDVIDASYKVVAITASQIDFEYLPSGARQSLMFPTRDN